MLLRAAPRPEPGELLASWMGRLACLYDAPPEALWQELAGTDHIPNKPSTDAPTIDELVRVAAAARLNVDALIATTVDFMLPAAPDGWLRARGSDLSSLPWCAACLRDDRRRGRVPHLRRLWAAACVAVCPRHQAPLTDFCPACANRTRAGFCWVRSHPILVCATCGADLTGGGTTMPAVRGVLVGCPPDAIVAVARLQATLLRAMRARHPVRDAFTEAIEVLAGHLLMQLGVARRKDRANGTADRCCFDNVGAEVVFMVLAALAALLALPAAEIEKELDHGFLTQYGEGRPINPVRLWACPAMTRGAVLRFDKRHWPDIAAKVGRAVVATLLHDPEMIALQNGCQHAAARLRAEEQRYQGLAGRIVANPAAMARLAAARTPGEHRDITGQLIREALDDSQATHAVPPVAANA
jgi:hypothetical protein